MIMMTNRVYLSRKNLQNLLSKLDRQLAGENTKCTIIKYKSGVNSFQQTMDSIEVIAVENKEYYEALGREPGVSYEDTIKVHSDTASY